MMMMTSRQFRSSMPDLNAVNKSYTTVAAATMADSHRRRQPSSSKKHAASRVRHPHHHSSTSSAGGFRLQKRSSSDEETSSLIDESERCLRSSIDLLLTDELPSPGGGDSSCFRFSGFGGSSAANIGGPGGYYSYSSRRSCSQPILNGTLHNYATRQQYILDFYEQPCALLDFQQASSNDKSFTVYQQRNAQPRQHRAMHSIMFPFGKLIQV